MGKSKKKKHGRLLPSRPAELPLLAERARRRACFTTVKNHKSLLSGNIGAYHACSTEMAFREISQHLTVSRFTLSGIFAFYGLREHLRASPDLKTTWKQRKKTKQGSSCILFCICKQSVPGKMKTCSKLISLLTVEASEAFQVLYSFQVTQAGKVNNKTVAWKCYKCQTPHKNEQERNQHSRAYRKLTQACCSHCNACSNQMKTTDKHSLKL